MVEELIIIYVEKNSCFDKSQMNIMGCIGFCKGFLQFYPTLHL